MSPARLAAFRVLNRVEEGAWASELLLSVLSKLDTRDAGLASEIVFGCLRRQAQLDHLIDLATGSRKLDRGVRVALRMGAYQLRHLDRVPAHAAINECVELAKRARKKSAAGLVNAVLRRIPQDEVEWPNRTTRLSMPEWLLAGWDAEFGSSIAERIAEAFLKPPLTYVRKPPAREDLVVEPTDVPGAYRVVRGDVRDLRVQDISSQAIVPMLDLQAGMTFLDLCSAPGNKTAQAMESGVTGVACDVHLHRLRQVDAGCPRVVLDAIGPLPFRTKFDRILVDTPCSGTGTLGRNPEIRWRLRPIDIEELHERQVAILRQGFEHLKAGGRLVYSTCSLERRENQDVVLKSGATVLKEQQRIPGVVEGDGFFAATMTV